MAIMSELEAPGTKSGPFNRSFRPGNLTGVPKECCVRHESSDAQTATTGQGFLYRVASRYLGGGDSVNDLRLASAGGQLVRENGPAKDGNRRRELSARR